MLFRPRKPISIYLNNSMTLQNAGHISTSKNFISRTHIPKHDEMDLKNESPIQHTTKVSI